MLKPFLIILVTLVAACSVIWGFPGVWSLLAVVPAFILGATLQHLRRPAVGDEPKRIRPGVLVLGGVFGLGTSMASVLVMWAAVAPEDITITAEIDIAVPPAQIWETLGEPISRPRWHTWMNDVEVTGRGGPPRVGSVYRSMLEVERQPVYASHEITTYEPDRVFAWTLVPKGGSALEEIHETITLSPDGDHTRVRYTLGYKVRSVMGRVGERLVIRRSLEKVAERSLELLADLVDR